MTSIGQCYGWLVGLDRTTIAHAGVGLFPLVTPQGNQKIPHRVVVRDVAPSQSALDKLRENYVRRDTTPWYHPPTAIIDVELY